jgi:hypothetical protein
VGAGDYLADLGCPPVGGDQALGAGIDHFAGLRFQRGTVVGEEGGGRHAIGLQLAQACCRRWR